MPKQRESSFQTAVVKRLREMGYLVKKVGTEGWPDYVLVNRYGNHFWMELKREGERLTPRQSEIAGRLVARDGVVLVSSPAEKFALLAFLSVEVCRSGETQYIHIPLSINARNPKWRNDPPTLPASAVSKRASARSALSRGRSASRRRSSADE